MKNSYYIQTLIAICITTFAFGQKPLSFIAFVHDISFTLGEQLPINVFINQLDLKTITAQQTQQLTEFQAKAISNFDKRFIHSTISFLLLCLTPFFLTRMNRQSK